MFKKFLIISAIFFFFVPFVFAQKNEKKEETESKSLFKNISFEENTFFGGINSSITKIVKNIEEWRVKQKESFDKSLDSTDDKRQTNKDEKSFNKVLIVAHLIILAILLFVFSIQVVFYSFIVFLVIVILRKIFNLVKRLFRREDTYV